MQINWYASVAGQTYGPYSSEDIRNMLSSGQLRPDTQLFHETVGSWQPAYALSQYANLSGPVRQPAYKKKKRGCLKIFVSIFLIISLMITGFIVFGPKGPRNLDLARAKTLEKASVDFSGGSIDAGDLIIEVPESAFEKKTNFKISTREIKDHRFGAAFNPITPVFAVENKGKYSSQPMTVTIPIQISEDEFAMAFYYNPDGRLEPMPLIYQDTTQVVVATKHFSDFLVSKIAISELMALDIDSGFRPGVDDWSFTNYGSQLAQGGHCAGQSVSMAYYYTELKKDDDPGLFIRYDNNIQTVKTPQFDRDDSLGIRLASVIQREGRWSGYYMEFLREQIHRQKYISDRLMYYAFAYALHLTGEPQVLGIFVRDDCSAEQIKLAAGHAVIVYRADKGTLHVSDPNFPGNKNLNFSLNGEVLGPYVSKTSADQPDRLYDSFSMVGKTALFDYARIAELFSEMNKATQTANIGYEGTHSFGNTEYNVIVDIDDNGDPVLAKMPELVVFEEDAKNRIREKFKTRNDAPDDLDTQDYLLITASADAANDGHARVYSGITEIAQNQVDGSDEMILYAPIKGGVNDIGIAFYDRGIVTYNNNNYYSDKFMHFYRLKVENGEVDLSGTWTGTMQLTDIGGALDYAQWLGELIAKGFMRVLAPLFEIDMPSDEEISQAVRSSIEVNEAALEPFPMVVELQRLEKNLYQAGITTTVEGEDSYYETTAEYKGGRLNFTVSYEDGSAARFSLLLYDNNVLAGEFEIGLSMFQSVLGESYLYR